MPSDSNANVSREERTKFKTDSKDVRKTDNVFRAAVENRSKKSPQIEKAFENIVAENTGGMPTGKRKFVRLSLRNIAGKVGNISRSTVGRWLRRRKFSLRSNGCRVWMWKKQLQQFADETGLKITVRHYPRGASKWNPVEHRLFGPISKNWAGHPLRSMAMLLGFIRGTTTQRGLKVKARWNRRKYNTKEKVSKEEQKSLNFKRHKVISLWNYTVFPKPKTQ